MRSFLFYALVGAAAVLALPLAFAVTATLLALVLKVTLLAVLGWAVVKAARLLVLTGEDRVEGVSLADRCDCSTKKRVACRFCEVDAWHDDLGTRDRPPTEDDD
jgi:hypothetical protein